MRDKDRISKSIVSIERVVSSDIKLKMKNMEPFRRVENQRKRDERIEYIEY